MSALSVLSGEEGPEIGRYPYDRKKTRPVSILLMLGDGWNIRVGQAITEVAFHAGLDRVLKRGAQGMGQQTQKLVISVGRRILRPGRKNFLVGDAVFNLVIDRDKIG